MAPLFSVNHPTTKTVSVLSVFPSGVSLEHTLPEHLFFLGSQAGTEGSCGLGWS